MSFTWTGDPANSTLEAIRWLIDDTASSNVKFQDAEILFAYDQENSLYGACALLCEQLAAKYAGEFSRTLGPLRVDLGNAASKYESRAKMFRSRAVAFATPYGGGLSEAKKLVFDGNTDLIPPAFEKGIHDND